MMSSKAPTMSHTEAQRKAWHKGKVMKHSRLTGTWETKTEWFKRVIAKDRNFAGGYTPPNFRLAYRALPEPL